MPSASESHRDGSSRSTGVAWIVDDSALEARFAERALVGWTVRAFTDGSMMLEALSTGAKPDLVLLDWHMPGLSGIEILRFVRSNPATAALPVLLLTVQSQTRDVVEGLRAGADDYVKKPYAPEELAARADAVVRTTMLRRRAESAEAGLSALLRHLPDLLLTIDEGGSIVFANDAASRVLGGTLLGRSVDEIFPGLLASMGPELAAVSDLVVNGRTFAPVIGSIHSEGRSMRAIALRDVTEQRRIEARRLDFYSIVAHDLRTPLTAISLRAERLLRGRAGALPAEALTVLQQMKHGVKQMSALVDDFLDVARTDARGVRVDAEPLDLTRVVVEQVDQLRAMAEDAGLTLTCNCNVGAAPIVGDARRLGQVVTNLLSNAIKFTPSGGNVEVNIERLDREVQVSFTDTGRGIAQDAVPVLFQRYARAVDAKAVSGTGLGLMIVREVVEAHLGTVGVESELGRGSRFWFTLPLAA